jgi:Zn-dependent peptidase ImmA (M78 family)
MAADYASAVRAGTMAAARLHRQLGSREIIETQGGSIDVFGAIFAIDLPLLLRPLQGLLGAYLNDPAPGVLVTTRRPMSIQRFTAAHELGHFTLRHEPSLDDESILRRIPLSGQSADNFQETEADAFAAAFMMPRWLIGWHCQRQGWQTLDLTQPNVVYQLALRIGASYEATCWTLVQNRLIARAVALNLAQFEPRDLKIAFFRNTGRQITAPMSGCSLSATAVRGSMAVEVISSSCDSKSIVAAATSGTLSS